ncbi:MAG: 30S ribosomal protein S20 [bacterium]|nr:30S ribosomal protein S20 [bacterium]MDE0670103.1 30S ribosomal protein S20 [bacterium]MXZ29313.1 30S ribosomal protein S20 [Acidimicrobiia bacterium]MYB24465.1 30S ribosomal protein S20 [Acidimicrobiia bacterium]MYJ13602.1 30S ribosomal protein S20 [Acidimicrobiia bacterium]
MANIKSQIKRNRQNLKRRARNRAVRAEINTRSASAESAARAGDADAAEKLRTAVKRIDMAAAKGVLHPNTASRRKSRLTRRVARINAGEEA